MNECLHVSDFPDYGLLMPQDDHLITLSNNTRRVSNGPSPSLIPDELLEDLHATTGINFPRSETMWNQYQDDWAINGHHDNGSGSIAIMSFGAPGEFVIIDNDPNEPMYEVPWDMIQNLDEGRLHRFVMRDGDMLFMPARLQESKCYHAIRGSGRRSSLVFRETTRWGGRGINYYTD